MCTETFLRLPAEKRERILDAAWEEFTTVPFTRASINQIVRRAGIPRGSFYQYFEDKSDLFSCLMEGVRDEIFSAARALLEEVRGDIFRSAVRAYDESLIRRRDRSSPLLERLIAVTRINPKIDLERFLTGDPDGTLVRAHMDRLDLSGFRRRDERFIVRVCCLTAVSVAGAIVDSLCLPERSERNREELIGSLDIVRRGSLSEEILRREADGPPWTETVGGGPLRAGGPGDGPAGSDAPPDRAEDPSPGRTRVPEDEIPSSGRTRVPDEGALRRGGAA